MVKARLASQTARIHADVLGMAHVVCALTRDENGRKLKLSELLDSILRPALTRMHADALARASRDAKED